MLKSERKLSVSVSENGRTQPGLETGAAATAWPSQVLRARAGTTAKARGHGIHQRGTSGRGKGPEGKDGRGTAMGEDDWQGDKGHGGKSGEGDCLCSSTTTFPLAWVERKN